MMKNKMFFLLCFMALFSMNSLAQEVSQECLMNISLFDQSVKNKQFADAVEPWMSAYTECPSAHKAIYSQGQKILAWQISQEKDATKRDELRNRLMEMYDKRIENFGDDARYPTPWILGRKAIDYITYFPEDKTKDKAYGWLKESIDAMGLNAEVSVMQHYTILSMNMYKKNKAEKAEQYINDYTKVSDMLTQISQDPANRSAKYATQVKGYLEQLFVASGVADCATLDEIYGPQVAEKSSDINFLGNVITFYERIKCTESEVYFAASEASHKIAPTAESANGCAQMSYKKGNIDAAISYYNQAVELSTDNLAKASYYLSVAKVLREKKRFSESRSYARKSLELNPEQGEPHIIIGLLYTESKPYPGDEILNKSVYWVAVDEFAKARKDPKLAEAANKMIATYSAYFPTKDDIFFHKEYIQKSTFYVGGWIQQSTSIRAKK